MMTKRAKMERMRRYKQKQLNRAFAILLIMHVFIELTFMCASLVRTSENNQIEGGEFLVVYEPEDKGDHTTATPPANVPHNGFVNLNGTETMPEIEEIEPFQIGRCLSDKEMYLLAKLAMAEAEGESLETKILVILVVLNRVESDRPYFPDTIEDVIYQNRNGVYEFTPIGNGRWDRVEPNEECWEAVRIVNSMPCDFDVSEGALYFEACAGESWHSRNLTFICQSDNTRFYKE